MKDKSEVEIVDLVLKLREKLVSPSLPLLSFLSLGGHNPGLYLCLGKPGKLREVRCLCELLRAGRIQGSFSPPKAQAVSCPVLS